MSLVRNVILKSEHRKSFRIFLNTLLLIMWSNYLVIVSLITSHYLQSAGSLSLYESFFWQTVSVRTRMFRKSLVHSWWKPATNINIGQIVTCANKFCKRAESSLIAHKCWMWYHNYDNKLNHKESQSDFKNIKVTVMNTLLVWFSSHIHLRRPICSQLMFSLSSGVIQGIWFIDYNFHKKIKQSSPTAESPELWTKKVILVSLPASSDWPLPSTVLWWSGRGSILFLPSSLSNPTETPGPSRWRPGDISSSTTVWWVTSSLVGQPEQEQEQCQLLVS